MIWCVLYVHYTLNLLTSGFCSFFLYLAGLDTFDGNGMDGLVVCFGLLCLAWHVNDEGDIERARAR